MSLLLSLLIILGPGLPSPYREDAPDFMGPLAARPRPSLAALPHAAPRYVHPTTDRR